jgi:hypothetical protein
MTLSTDAARASYASDIDFRVGQSPPDNLPPEVQGMANELYNTLQQIIFTFINKCGISQQDTAMWELLATLPGSTIQAQNLRRIYVEASEPILLGGMVSLTNVAGALRARNANATNNTRPADGFCSTIGGVASGEVGEFILSSGIATVTGLTVGTRYYLSTSNGLVANGPAVAAGNIEQYIGIALSPTELYVNMQYWIQH